MDENKRNSGRERPIFETFNWILNISGWDGQPNRQPRGERCRVHHEGHQWHQEGSGVPVQGQEEEDNDAALHDHRRRPGHLHGWKVLEFVLRRRRRRMDDEVEWTFKGISEDSSSASSSSSVVVSIVVQWRRAPEVIRCGRTFVIVERSSFQSEKSHFRWNCSKITSIRTVYLVHRRKFVEQIRVCENVDEEEAFWKWKL